MLAPADFVPAADERAPLAFTAAPSGGLAAAGGDRLVLAPDDAPHFRAAAGAWAAETLLMWIDADRFCPDVWLAVRPAAGPKRKQMCCFFGSKLKIAGPYRLAVFEGHVLVLSAAGASVFRFSRRVSLLDPSVPKAALARGGTDARFRLVDGEECGLGPGPHSLERCPVEMPPGPAYVDATADPPSLVVLEPPEFRDEQPRVLRCAGLSVGAEWEAPATLGVLHELQLGRAPEPKIRWDLFEAYGFAAVEPRVADARGRLWLVVNSLKLSPNLRSYVARYKWVAVYAPDFAPLWQFRLGPEVEAVACTDAGLALRSPSGECVLVGFPEPALPED